MWKKLIPSKRLVQVTLLLVVLLTALHLFVASNPKIDPQIRILQQLTVNASDFTDISQYFFNSYYDTRSSLRGKRFVRIISVFDTNSFKETFHCQFFDSDGEISFSANGTKSKIGGGMPSGKKYFQEFVLSCPISSDLSLASFVVVQSQSGKYRSRVISVQHNPLSNGSLRPTRSIVNCVSVTFGNPSPQRLIEWLEAQRLFGMDKVVLHFHHVTSKEFVKVAQEYERDGLVDIRTIECPFCEKGKEDYLGLLLMSPAINQCFYENLGGFTYTAVFDLDEIIVPQRHENYQSMLAQLNSTVNTSSFAFNNWYHFLELGHLPQLPKYLQMLRHPFRTNQPSDVGYSTKSIHKSDYVVALHNHFSWEDVPNAPTKVRWHAVPVSIGINQHFKKCHFSEVECKSLTNQSTRRIGDRLNKLIGSNMTAAVERRIQFATLSKV